jgi:hypothetical protein
MTEEKGTSAGTGAAPGAGTGARRCAFCEAGGLFAHFARTCGPSDEVRAHLRQSRIEFLKAIRQILDDRIEYVSRRGQKGTRVTVE